MPLETSRQKVRALSAGWSGHSVIPWLLVWCPVGYDDESRCFERADCSNYLSWEDHIAHESVDMDQLRCGGLVSCGDT